ncbi:MAG: alanine transaminase [Deltaproteobacteria bacterium]|nr:alanine transaminase [Deltaproteobacteria bacterium]MCZ6548520.1 alanine transaminase [Deltaproteobacteria bacterium]MCZ6562715.1 alanine transaminase [Deltaproteobacteria bacterium]
MEFNRIKRLPPYVFNILNDLKQEARRKGEDIVDFGMGNPDQPTPAHVVSKLVEAAKKPPNHRYSASKGIYKLRLAIADWYQKRFQVSIDPDSEAIVTIGSKEGLAHLVMAILDPGDVVFCPSPTYPIHPYSVIIAGGDLRSIPMYSSGDLFSHLQEAVKQSWPKPKLLIINFPHNPTTEVVDLDFFYRIVQFAQEHGLLVIHDFTYADIAFDGFQPPSFLQVPEAREIGVEFFSLSKSYNMPGWRVGFAVGNSDMIKALARIKSYLDYGIFQPIQIAAIHALNGPQQCVEEIRERYRRRRDTLVNGLDRIGWKIKRPKATMFVWAEIPEACKKMGSLDFSKFLLNKAKVAVSPGIGFGEYGDSFVRFALIENEHRTRQAVRTIRKALGKYLD